MFDHLGLHVADLGKSTRFYEAALAPLGYVMSAADEGTVSFGPPGAPALYLYGGKAAVHAGMHLAFTAKARASVEQFYERGLRAGGKDNGAPGVRADYAHDYYAAFLIDPDGNNLEAVCFSD